MNDLNLVKQFSTVILFLSLNINLAHGQNLIDIIPSLYGSDGVQLVGTTRGFSHAPHFQDDSLLELVELAEAASSLKLPVPSQSGGLTFTYDSITDDFIQSTDSLGLAYSEYARTIGDSQTSLGFVIGQVKYSKYNGRRLGNYDLQLEHEDLAGPGADICVGGPPDACYLFENDTVLLELDIDLETEFLVFYGTQGISHKFDVGIQIPIVHHRLSVSSQASVIEDETKQFFTPTLHHFDEAGVNGDAPQDSVSGSSTGIGDIRIHGKYQFLESSLWDAAALLQFRLPTGDENNLMGFGNYGAKIQLIGSRTQSADGLPISTHYNIGYEKNTGVFGQNEINYGFGADYTNQKDNHIATYTLELIGNREVGSSSIGGRQLDIVLGVRRTVGESGMVSASIRHSLSNTGLEAAPYLILGYEKLN